jgi:hypothetical protein
MKILPYTIYLKMQPNALLIRQNFIICKKVGVTVFHKFLSTTWLGKSSTTLCTFLPHWQ